MSLWAIIPVKPLNQGKTRLSGVLSDQERIQLSLELFTNTLKIVSAVSSVQQVEVVSQDPEVLEFTKHMGAMAIEEDDNPDLNNALNKATSIAIKNRATEILIIPVDLPVLFSSDIDKFLSLASNPPEMIIVPDRRWDGTNLMYVTPPGKIKYSYGSSSFRKHINEAQAKKFNIKLCMIPTLRLDLDLPEDLELLHTMKIGSSENRLLLGLIKYFQPMEELCPKE